MVLVSVSIHEARVSSTFFGGLKASRRWKLKKIIILENIKSNELSLVFSKIVSKGLCCDKVWGISIFSSCTPIRGIYRKSLLRGFYYVRLCTSYRLRQALSALCTRWGYCTVLGAVYMEGGRFSHQEQARRRKNFSLGLHAEIVVRAVNRREGNKEQR